MGSAFLGEVGDVVKVGFGDLFLLLRLGLGGVREFSFYCLQFHPVQVQDRLLVQICVILVPRNRLVQAVKNFLTLSTVPLDIASIQCRSIAGLNFKQMAVPNCPILIVSTE